MEEQKENKQLLASLRIPTERIGSLADNIFGFAMTLLVVSISLPTLESQTDTLQIYLSTQSRDFLNFAVSFILLGLFWLYFNQLNRHIKKASTASIALNLLMMMFVVLVPHSTNLINAYPHTLGADLFFDVNMFLLSILISINWIYCYQKGFVESEGIKSHITRINYSVFFLPLIAIIALVVNTFLPGWGDFMYLLMPVAIIYAR